MSVTLPAPPTDPSQVVSYLQTMYLRLNGSQSFSVTKNGTNQTIPNNVPTELTWSKTEWDTTGGINLVPNAFVCKNAGKFEFSLLATLSSPTVTLFTVNLVLNGTAIASNSITVTTANPSVMINKQLNLNYSDTVTCTVLQDTGAAAAVLGAVNNTYFQGKRIT